jgi:hypothetical protein
MPNPCAGVPANPWCPPVAHHHAHFSYAVAVAVAGHISAVPGFPPLRRDRPQF